MKTKTILVTGAAGFIGYSLCKKLKNNTILGVDNFYSNYNIQQKKRGIKELVKNKNFHFIKGDIREAVLLKRIFKRFTIDKVVHLAALTGVRASLNNPDLYYQANVLGTKRIYEISIKNNVKQFIFASSSSVYGKGTRIPFTEKQKLFPQSPYAQTKKKAEDILSELRKKYQMPTTILRLFSVYGPHGRPDMAPYKFTEAAYFNKVVPFYGAGESARDYTYIDDVISAFKKALDRPQTFLICNIGNASPVKLIELARQVEFLTKKKLNLVKKPSNPAESFITWADISLAQKKLDWKPRVSFPQGMKKFVTWFVQKSVNGEYIK